MNPLLEETYAILRNHQKPVDATPFDTLCRILYKDIHLPSYEDQAFGMLDVYGKRIDLDPDKTTTRRDTRRAKELKPLVQHDRSAPHPAGVDNPVILAEFEEQVILIDGNNRTNHWYQVSPEQVVPVIILAVEAKLDADRPLPKPKAHDPAPK